MCRALPAPGGCQIPAPAVQFAGGAETPPASASHLRQSPPDVVPRECVRPGRTNLETAGDRASVQEVQDVLHDPNQVPIQEPSDHVPPALHPSLPTLL